ncbi:DsbA family oxidoreductase [Paenibacillus taichungensis]|uniref:DsbA family oxidoreductase n=1 Tax=Paenibacillus taichungensis TaxID=484184 RepID=A0ABX2MS70_9BACL|nr:DsbA family oxidoreductase [Paenibacillus taichungensis]NUU56940.1 DsbA family oxidoreductase [Paenibacillus taichungensis]
MKIQIWSDIACPFCYIAKQNLEQALIQLPSKDQVRIEYKSFELDPSASLYDGKSYMEKLASKFGGMEQAKQFLNHLTQQAENVGLSFNLDRLKSTNTLDAHRLLKWAKTQGEEEATLNDKLLNAHFTESKDVGDIETLADIAQASGFNREEALEALRDKAGFTDQVREDQQQAREYGISGVPFFIFNEKYALSGAQPAEVFSQVLEKILEEGRPATRFEVLSNETAGEGLCTDEGCAIPPRKK